MNTNRTKFLDVRIAGALVDTGYTAIGNPLEENVYMIIATNEATVVILFSLDGINDSFAINRRSTIPINFSTNRTIDNRLYLPKGTQFYAKTVTGVLGANNVFISLVTVE